MFFRPNYNTAKNQLDRFISLSLNNYSKLRNFDNGPDDRKNVSCLSPFIKKRIIHEKEIIKCCLEKFKINSIEKFIQEVIWRTYWKGWLEGRKEVWNDYNRNLNKLKNNVNKSNYKKDYNRAITGKTGINCFDLWVNELIKFGYLHNHARMWFASIWIFTLNLPWELGANFFYRNLLDADAASNTLSWRWVAGLQTKGKVYLAREENIEKFSKFSFQSRGELARTYKEPIHKFYEYIQPSYLDQKVEKIDYFLINSNNLSYDKKLLKELENVKVLYFKLSDDSEDGNIKKKFDDSAIKEYIDWLKQNKIYTKTIIDEDHLKSEIQESYLITQYPSVGYELDKLESISRKSKFKVQYIFDSFDLKCWPYAKSGFFKFKTNINNFVEDISHCPI